MTNADERRERARELSRMWYRRMMADPDRYAKYREAKRRWKAKNRDRLNAERREWRRKHHRRYLRQLRFERDRRNMRFRQSPELYAEWLEKRRRYKMIHRRRMTPGMRAYRARPCMRVPVGCSFGRTLDTRSVFLWNNLPAASLVAGRAFRALQWRETHCDRFGEVVR